LFDQGEPPLGHMIIGSGCMFSGEDFSNIKQASPMYYPNRARLLGQQFTKAKPYCEAPIYLFGILLFIILIILSYLLVKNHLAVLFSASFFAFYPLMQDFSRQMHVDIISWVFIALSLIFIYMAYLEEKQTKKEYIYFTLTAVFLALSLATKFSAGLMLILAMLIFILKYKKEIIELIKSIADKINAKEQKAKLNADLIKLMLTIIIVFGIIFLAPFQFSISNVFDTYAKFNSHNPGDSTAGIHINIIKTLADTFLININILDLILFIVSLYILYQIITKKEKTKSEIFILASWFIFIFGFLFANAFHLTRIASPYLFIIPITMSLIFSGSYKPKINKKYLSIILIICIIFAFTIAFNAKPDFQAKNPIICHFNEYGCQTSYSEEYGTEQLVKFMKENLQKGETAIGDLTETFYFQMLQNQAEQNYLFDIQFRQQTGRAPNLIEKAFYFQPDSKKVRYVVLRKNNNDSDAETIRNSLNPVKTITYKNQKIYEIYDIGGVVAKMTEQQDENNSSNSGI